MRFFKEFITHKVYLRRGKEASTNGFYNTFFSSMVQQGPPYALRHVPQSSAHMPRMSLNCSRRLSSSLNFMNVPVVLSWGGTLPPGLRPAGPKIALILTNTSDPSANFFLQITANTLPHLGSDHSMAPLKARRPLEWFCTLRRTFGRLSCQRCP
jgi:hypothetical protein